MFLNPTIDDFKTYFVRDFPFGTDFTKNVLDADVSKAFQLTNQKINQALFSNQEGYTLGYMLLSAHCLVVNLRSSSQGLGGQFSWLESSKSVGSVSQSFSIPQRILDNPIYAFYTRTNYGAQYLELVLPMMTGVVLTGEGRTLA